MTKELVKDNIQYYLDMKYNKSSYYLFPIIYTKYVITPEVVSKINIHGFRMVNIFLGDSQKEEYSDYLDNSFLLMLLEIDDYSHEDFRYFMDNITSNDFYNTYYHVKENLIMVVFKVSEEYRKIIKSFKRGKYSEFPEDYRLRFLSTANYSINSCYNVITKNPFLKKKIEKDLGVTLPQNAELDDLPYRHKEIFRYNGS